MVGEVLDGEADEERCLEMRLTRAEGVEIDGEEEREEEEKGRGAEGEGEGEGEGGVACLVGGASVADGRQ